MDKYLADYKAAHDYAENSFHETWDDCWALYNNERIEGLIGYEGISNTFDPMTFSIVESILSHVWSAKPKFSFIPTNPQQSKEVNVLNALMDYYWDCNNMSRTAIVWGREVLITGNGSFVLGWEEDKPKIKHVPIRDCFFDPACSTPGEWRYAGYKRLDNINDLRKVQTVSAKGKVSSKYDLKGLPMFTGQPNDPTDKVMKDILSNSTLSDEQKKEQVEVITLYYPDKIVEIGNRSKVISEVPNPFQRKAHKATIQIPQTDQNGQPAVDPQSGQPIMQSQQIDVPEVKAFIPMILQRNYVDGAILYGKGEVEPIAGQQEELNDLENQTNDATTYSLNPMWAVDPQYKDLIPQIESLPGAVYALAPGAYSQMNQPVNITAAESLIQAKKTAMRQTTGADEIVQGTRPDLQATATQINAQTASAGQRFGMKLQMLENEGYKTLAEMMFKMVQIFVTDEQVVRIVGKQGIEWARFNPDAYWGTYEPRVQLDINAKAMQAAEAKQYSDLFQVAMGSPYVNQMELWRLLFQRVFNLDEDETSTLMQGSKPMHPIMEKMQLDKVFPVLAPEIQAQILELMGLQPPQDGSPMTTNGQQIQLQAQQQQHQQTHDKVGMALQVQAQQHAQEMAQQQAMQAAQDSRRKVASGK